MPPPLRFSRAAAEFGAFRRETSVSAAAIEAEASVMITIKRAYDPPSRTDGARILVDRLWPRGIKKEDARVEKWMREIGPSDELRRFFGHDPARWPEFRKRYLTELRRPEAKPLLAELETLARHGTLTLVYSARDEDHNQAVVLKELLEKQVSKSSRAERARQRPRRQHDAAAAGR